MATVRTKRNRPGRTKRSRHGNSLQLGRPLDHAVAVIDTVCCLAGDENLIGNQSSQETRRLRRAIAEHDTACLFEQLMEAFSLQGISDHAAYTYMDRHGRLTWRDLQKANNLPPICSKLRCYWTFHNCGFQKATRTCTEPKILKICPLPRHDLRNGRLNQTGYSLFLFIQDVTGGDLVGWIDSRLKQASEGGVRGRAVRMRNTLVEPLRNLFGVSDKVLNMTLAWLLMAAPHNKALWLQAGVHMNAVDTLVHAFLQRTGILRRFSAEHMYGSACYDLNGCADIIARIAKRINARRFNPSYPKFFPRFVQHAIWRYCAQLELNICNGNQIDDRDRCANRTCPLFSLCDRVSLQRE